MSWGIVVQEQTYRPEIHVELFSQNTYVRVVLMIVIQYMYK